MEEAGINRGYWGMQELTRANGGCWILGGVWRNLVDIKGGSGGWQILRGVN